MKKKYEPVRVSSNYDSGLGNVVYGQKKFD